MPVADTGLGVRPSSDSGDKLAGKSDMWLYLSSFGLGRHARLLSDLMPARKNAAIIMNACDLMEPGQHNARLPRDSDALKGLGFATAELDPREYFGNGRAQLAQLVASYDLVWVRGGNAFAPHRAMKQSCFDSVVSERLRCDALVYGGFSAAAAMVGPSLRGAEPVDDPDAVPVGYDSAVVWDCLNLLACAIAPHYRSDHPESADVGKLVQYYIDHHILFIALRDGQVVIVEGARTEILQ
jgi:dipeptidase E